MSVKNFKFVSPGVFINEIDNSFIPKSPVAIGPVVIGRSKRGLALQPVQVESYSDFVEMFGDTVPGGGGTDVTRDGNFQSPMYGTYAAKAFLNAGVAPLTYVRLLGEQSSTSNTGDAAAGWKTQKNPTEILANNGGAYGLWLFSSGTAANMGTGSLAAVWYLYNGSDIYLSGAVRGGALSGSTSLTTTGSNNVVIGTDSDNLFTIYISGTVGGPKKIRFGFDDSESTFVRKRFNTNPSLCSTKGTFYAAASAEDYWLGESFEQEVRDKSLVGTAAHGVLLAIAKGSDITTGPHNKLAQASKEGRSGWFIGQDLGAAASYVNFRKQKLFRLIGRGHGEWLHKNCKISIEKIRQSTTTTTDYGTFSLIIRRLDDTDNNVIVMERFDNLTLDPTSPDYVARRVGDTYNTWDAQERRIKTYGEYPNQSKFVYIEMNADVDAGATTAELLPFGYFGPPRFRTVYDLNSTGNVRGAPSGKGGLSAFSLSNFFITGGYAIPNHPGRASNAPKGGSIYLSGGIHGIAGNVGQYTGTLEFPSVRLRTSASDGGMSNRVNAYYGMQVTRTSGSTRSDPSVADVHNLLYSNYGDNGGGQNPITRYTNSGVDDFSYIFSLDDIVLKSSTTDDWYWVSGSRAAESSYTSASYKDLLNASINRFTAPIFGGFDGFNVTKPDPLYNKGMNSTDTETSNYIYYTWKRAIDTVADPEFVNMNLMATPGLTHDSLTTHAVNTCEERADAMALIDLKDVYIPPHEQYYSSKASRVGSTPATSARLLKERTIDSSYGATFYPWVQTRDETTGQLLWIPPSVAMMGVLASSEKKSEIWFAPAGFNRGGLTEGAAGIPISNISERLVSNDRDTLYEANINPIASFPSSGIVVFGQKTLQERRSALDRINVRRLVIYLKKTISVLSTQILFEQNVQATWNRFIGLIDPLLANVKGRFGITDYRLILDDSTTTPDLIDQNVLYAKIMVKPARAIEYIAIDFVIMSTGASFDD